MDSQDPERQSRTAYFESLEDLATHHTAAPSLAALVARRYSRRDLFRGALGVVAAGLVPPLLRHTEAHAAPSPAPRPAFAFSEIARGVDGEHHVAAGYDAEVLIRWGDPVLPGAPPFDPQAQSAAAQLAQSGFNNDFVGYIPLPPGSANPSHGLLCVNHEYTSEEVMFPGVGAYDRALSQATAALVEIEMAAHGGSIVEIVRERGHWRVVPESRYARRISASATPMRLSGPAAGHPRLRTAADPSGTRVIGTLNNCAGGITPWGTYLMAEENFHNYFIGNLDGHPERERFARYGIPGGRYAWGRYHPRFDVRREPREANRFGWIVEVDPFAPDALPVKRTALGRLKHEGAETVINRDGRLVLYTGDDQHFEYLYRFVSEARVDPHDRAANRDLLDHGTLSVARFHADGTLEWLPLVHGRPGLTAADGFASQAEVLIDTRLAASALGATPLDRPEDVEPDPVHGRVYVMLTNNARRGPDAVDAVNPRAHNLWGQVVELTPADGDHAAPTARWEILVRAGDPADPGVAAAWHPATSDNGWFACPDNAAVDPQGRLWVATDQGKAWRRSSGGADGLWALETDGPGRGTGRMFFRAPVGAELCGPRFTPDGRTLFVAVQHPGVDGGRDLVGFARDSTFEDPATRWPDFEPGMPPRPAVVVITRRDGGVIGG